MATPINDPQVVEFCNADLRPLGDKLAALDALLGPILATYNARDLGTIINDWPDGGAANFIADGSETDGRTRVTGGDVFQMMTMVNDLITFFTAQRRETIYKWQVNGVRVS